MNTGLPSAPASPAAAPASSDVGNSSDAQSNESLDLLIAFRRAELDIVQSRLDRLDSNAAAVISASVAVGALAASTFAAVSRTMSTFSIVCASLGGALVLVALLGSLDARDSSEQHNRIGKVLVAIFFPLKGLASDLLCLRAGVTDGTLDATPETAPGLIRLRIAASLEARLGAARKLARKLDTIVALLTLSLAAGAVVLILGVVSFLVGF